MNKLVLLIGMALAFASCEGPVGPMGPAGEPGPGMNWNVEYFTVYPNEWEFMGNSDNPNEIYYRCIKPFANKLPDKERIFIYDSGVTSTFMYTNYDTDAETQTSLPYVLNWTDNYNNLCVETYYSDYTVNDVAFYVAYSGGNQDNQPTQPIVYRVVMNW